MKLVVQRVKHADVKVDGKATGKINEGFLVLLGVAQDDTEEIADKFVKKLVNLRVFSDENDKMNKSIKDIMSEQGVENITDDSEIRNIVKEIISNNPESVNDYKAGHDRAIKFLMGQVMKETKGKVNPKMAMDILTEELN